MTLSLTLSTHYYKYGKRGEVHHYSGCRRVSPRGGGGAGKAHKPDVYRTSQERFLVFSAFCHPRSLRGAAGAIIYNPHPREPQHSSRVCKPNCWGLKGCKTGKAMPLRDVRQTSSIPNRNRSNGCAEWISRKGP